MQTNEPYATSRASYDSTAYLPLSPGRGCDVVLILDQTLTVRPYSSQNLYASTNHVPPLPPPIRKISDVGRVSDWHKKAAAAETIGGAPAPPGTANAPVSCASEDPGVKLTTDLKDYFVAHGLPTEVMGASFRNVDQVEALAGCDHLTIGDR